jgi:selenocysteine-specific elongation factor
MNVNVAILGHIDHGKTELARCLSTVLSTAALDKHPQSKERGITLDLGFSSFELNQNFTITLIDAPGHASLIRSVLGAAQIVDICLLVVDINKGFQTQTSECLVIAECLCDRLIVVLNKIDLLGDKLDEAVNKMTNNLNKILSLNKQSKFYSKYVPIIKVSALKNEGISELQTSMIDLLASLPIKRDVSFNQPFAFLFDHCFAIKGQGTVITGNVISGCLKTGEMLEFPGKVLKKVKSMQVFRKTVPQISQGDRAGLCIPGLEITAERGIAVKASATTGNTSMQLLSTIRIEAELIKYFKHPVTSKTKFHFTVGHETSLGRVIFLEENSNDMYSECFSQSAIVQFENPFYYPIQIQPRFIASKLDLDATSPECRIAFHGKVVQLYEDPSTITISRKKVKRGSIERSDGNSLYYVKDLLKKDSDYNKIFTSYVSTVIHEDSKAVGVVEGPFGKSGKLKVRFRSTGLSGNVVYEYTKKLNLLFNK